MRRLVTLALLASVLAPGSTGTVDARSTPDLRALVDRAATAAGVPRPLAHAVIRTESDYRVRLRGRAGEYGLGQIKCQTARETGFRSRCAQLLDPVTNLRFSMLYLRQALKRGGSGCAGISLYNRGLYAKPVCTAYGRKILRRA